MFLGFVHSVSYFIEVWSFAHKEVCLGKGEFYPTVINLYRLFSAGTSRHVLEIKRCETHYYSSHFNAYVVSVLSPSVVSCLEVSSLPLYPVVHAHKSFHGSETYLVLKQYAV